MKTYRVQLTGKTPLLMHWDNIDWDDYLKDWRKIAENKAASKPGDDRTPPFAWKGYVYHDGELLAIPQENVRTCLMEAGKKLPAVSNGRGSMKTDAISNVLIDDAFLAFSVNGRSTPWASVDAIDGTFKDHCDAAKKLGFSLFVKRAAVGTKKHVRVRPRFDKWAVEFTITVLDDAITCNTLDELFRVAGKYIGLGDWRPGEKKSPGPFGQFDAEIMEL